MAIVEIDGRELPRVHRVEESREIIGDRRRTAGGTMRQDISTVKRVWEIETRPITQAERNEIIDYLDGILYSSIAFWLDEFGDKANTVDAYVTEPRTTRSLRQRHKSSVSLRVEEQ